MLELRRDFFPWRQTVGYVKVTYCISVGREGVEGASESLVFSSFVSVLGNPASDHAASGRLFSAVLFMFVREWAGAAVQSSLPWSPVPLCRVLSESRRGFPFTARQCKLLPVPWGVSLWINFKSSSSGRKIPFWHKPVLNCLITSSDAWKRTLAFYAGLTSRSHSQRGFPSPEKNGEELPQWKWIRKYGGSCWGLERRVTQQEKVQKLNM